MALSNALSLLTSMASGYPPQGSQKAIATPPSLFTGAIHPPTAPVGIPTAPSSNKNPASNSSTPPSRNSVSNLCDVCHARPKFHDGVKVHAYCSKGCAAKAKPKLNGATATKNTAKSGNCEFCLVRPKFVDGSRAHDFCSKACANDFQAGGQLPMNAPPVSQASKGTNTCQALGCQLPAHMNPDGTPGEFCSLAHKTLSESVCLMCLQTPKQVTSHFCGQSCQDEADKLGAAILEVPVGHVTFQSVTSQFNASWRHPGTVRPTVRRVYKILSTQSSLANYDAYRSAVEARGQFVAAGRSAGNENRRWHGTRRECRLGDPGNVKFCAAATCSLCCVVRTSFDLSLFGKKTGWGRFGKGIYTSSTSSKANDYSHNASSSPYKAILLNKVIVGKGRKLTQDNTSLNAPPNGYDSILAEVGGSLNYDELVVYTNDAIRPSFLVIYDK